jgi:hypothetical protein
MLTPPEMIMSRLRQPVVHWHGDGAHRARGRACEEHVGRVRCVDDSMVARLEPEADQPMREPIPSLEEVLPAQDRVAVNDGGMVGLPRGVGGEEVHAHTILRSGFTGR